MDEARLAEIEARLKAVSPGPWRLGSFWETAGRDFDRGEVWASEPKWTDGMLVTHHYAVLQPWSHIEDGVWEGDEPIEALEWLAHTPGDAAFFAHAPADVTELLAEVRRLRAAAAIPGGGGG
jgi:hypothetical protein